MADIPGVEMVETVTADEMASEVLKRYEETDVVIMAAAVADYRPEKFYDEKVKKSDGDWNLRLVRNVDILKLLGEKKTKQKLVGFAAETENLLENAQKKLIKKMMFQERTSVLVLMKTRFFCCSGTVLKRRSLKLPKKKSRKTS